MEKSDKVELEKELRKLHHPKGNDEKSVNIGLLIIIVALLICGAVAVVYFEWLHGETLNESLESQQAKSSAESQAQNCQSTLDSAIMRLSELSEELNITESSRYSLNELYSDLSGEKDTLEGELTGAKTDLSMCNSELNNAEADLSTALLQLQQYISEYNRKVASLKAANEQISDLDDINNALETRIGELQDDLSDLQSEYDSLVDCVDADSNCSCST